MKHLAVTALALLPLVAAVACDLPEVEPPDVPDVPPPPPPPDIAAELEDAIFDKLECEEIVRPSTLNRVRDLLEDPTFDEVQALLTNPQDLATVVSMAGAEVEGAVIVARNIERLLSDGTAQQLVDGGWDGVACGEAVDFSCTAGEEATTVDCDVDTVTSVTTDFSLCTLGGTVHDGAMTIDRIEGVDTSARVTFANLAFDEVKVLDGTVALAVETTGVHATLGDGLSYTEHGGPDGGVSCGARLSLDTLELDVDDDATIEFAGSRATADGQDIAIQTTQPLVFDAASTCACPNAGGGIKIDVPRPLGREGETAQAAIEFVSTSDPGLCAEASVTLENWPSTCDLGGDCAKGATQATLSRVMSALCTEL